jgi:hypothetical protein
VKKYEDNYLLSLFLFFKLKTGLSGFLVQNYDVAIVVFIFLFSLKKRDPETPANPAGTFYFSADLPLNKGRGGL